MAVPSPRLGLDVNITAEEPHRRASPALMLGDDCERRTFATGDDMVARLDDRRLFVGDLLDGVAKIFLVVEVDVGDDSNTQIERVGRVEPASEANLADQPIDPRRQV